MQIRGCDGDVCTRIDFEARKVVAGNTHTHTHAEGHQLCEDGKFIFHSQWTLLYKIQSLYWLLFLDDIFFSNSYTTTYKIQHTQNKRWLWRNAGQLRYSCATHLNYYFVCIFFFGYRQAKLLTLNIDLLFSLCDKGKCWTISNYLNSFSELLKLMIDIS